MKKLSVFLVVVLAIVLMALPTITAKAWVQPSVSALCAPDTNTFSFQVTLTGTESNYKIDWSWNSNFSGYTMKDLGSAGSHTVNVSRGSHSNGDKWYVRWHSDQSSSNYAQANGTLCHQSHTVTWATSASCTEWNATYAIDGGAPVVYDSGVWTYPYVLETASPKAFTVPEIPGDTYDYPNAPSVTVNEPANCQKVHHVIWDYGFDACLKWFARYAIDSGPMITYDSGLWTDPYNLEVGHVKAFDIPTVAGELYDFPHHDAFDVNEPANCLIILQHNASINVENSCKGWSSALSSSDGGVGTPTTPTSGVWVDPYNLEHASVSYNVVWPDGYSTVVSTTVNEPENCLRFRTSVGIVDGKCQFGQGTQKTFVVGEGLTVHIIGDGGFKQDITAGSTTITFPNGHFSWTVTAAEGYDIVGPTSGDFSTDDFTCRPIPTCPTCGPRVEEIAKSPNDLVIVDYGRGPCTICLKAWKAGPLEHWRYARSIKQFSIMVSVHEADLIAAGIKYRTVPYQNHPDYKPMLYIDSVPFAGLDGVTYYILDLNKAVVGNSWVYYDTASGKPYTEVWGWNSTTRSAYVDCSRTVGPWDISAAGIASRLYGNPSSSDWVKFLMDSGYDANKAIQWSLQLWASQDGTLALPGDFVFKP